MSFIFLLLNRVHEKVHDLAMELTYSEPKIFTGGVDINGWSKLSLRDKKKHFPKNGLFIFLFEILKQIN
jgi:hypothetical protein